LRKCRCYVSRLPRRNPTITAQPTETDHSLPFDLQNDMKQYGDSRNGRADEAGPLAQTKHAREHHGQTRNAKKKYDSRVARTRRVALSAVATKTLIG
jgi:hypothetical protein